MINNEWAFKNGLKSQDFTYFTKLLRQFENDPENPSAY